MSDTESLQLVEATATLNVIGSSPPVKTPVSKLVKINDDSGPDSGYASQSTLQGLAPDNPTHTFIEGRGVIGGSRAAWSLIRPKIRLILFDKPITKPIQQRFEDLQELHADGLNRLTRGFPWYRGILMSLKMLGENESTAAPWIFIQYNKIIAPKVRRFFKQPSMESDFKPSRPDVYSLVFNIYIHKIPPTILHGMPGPSETEINDPNTIKVWCNQEAILSCGSLYRSRINVSPEGSMQSATIGGLISVITRQGEIQKLGLTVGYFLTKELYTGYSENEEESDKYKDEIFDENQDTELDLSLFTLYAPVYLKEDVPQEQKLENIDTVLGYIYKTLYNVFQDQPNLD